MPPVDLRTWLFIALALVAAAFVWQLANAVRTTSQRRDDSAPDGRIAPSPWEIFVGVLTDFFDTLGIGSYATTTALFRLRKTVPDEQIPGTLNIGHLIPTFVQAFIYITVVKVDAVTLVLMIVAAVVGAAIGARTVARWPRRPIQIGMGVALLVAATLLILGKAKLLPVGGEALSLTDGRLAIGLAGNFVLGTLMPLGIGLYGPCMILVSLLGMNPSAAFPIMMGSCAFLMPVANIEFINRRRFRLPAALGLTLGGVPAVLVAALIVRQLDLEAVRWLVLAVVLYTATTLLMAAASTRGQDSTDRTTSDTRPVPSA